jgi:riboflavin synthase
MFTGLVEDLGTVVSIASASGGGARLSVRTKLPEPDLFHGASVAVDGACLTVVAREGQGEAQLISFDASPETLARTTLGLRKAGDRVNLERPLALGERLGGHLVLGHVDGIGHLVSRIPQGEGVRFRVSLPEGLAPLVVEKGSITLDGVSLTVNDLLGEDDIALFLIPESLRATTWGTKQPGEAINCEADILGKHVARLLSTGHFKPGGGGGRRGVDLPLLERSGFLGE